MIGKRIAVLEKFFKVKMSKEMNPIEWLEELYEMEMKWEDEHQKPIKIKK